MAVQALSRETRAEYARGIWRSIAGGQWARWTFLRFAIVGGLGYLVYQAVLFLAYELDLPLLPPPGSTLRVPFLAPDARLLAASLLAAEASILTVFFIHTRWTFRERASARDRGLLARLLAFHAKAAVSTFGVLTVGVNALSGGFGVDPYVAATIGTLVAFVWNWVWDSRLIWAASRTDARPRNPRPVLEPAADVRARAGRAAPYALAAVLAILAAGLWGYVIVQTIDRWDGESAARHEDVVAYYAAGSLLREDRAEGIYQPDVMADAEREILGRPAGRQGGLVFMNPPFVAGLFEPIAGLLYGHAQALWLAISSLAVFASLALLAPEIKRLPRRWAAVFVLAALASFPIFWSLLYGQLSSLVLLSWVLFYRLLKNGRQGPAGLALALSLVKPQLVLVPLIYLLVTKRWRALGAFGVGSLALVAASVAFVGVETTFVSYPRFLLDSLRWREEFGINREGMFGWSSYLGLLLPDLSRRTLLMLTGVVSAATLLLATFVWRKDKGLDIAAPSMLALATATILTSPHLHLQDLQVLLVPAALLVTSRRDAVSAAVPALLSVLVPLALVVNLATPALAVTLVGVAAIAAGLRMPAAVWLLARTIHIAGRPARLQFSLPPGTSPGDARAILGRWRRGRAAPSGR